MCGRFNLIADGEQIAMAFGLNEVPYVEPRFNIAPTQPVAAIRHNQMRERELTHLHWGLVPSWAKDTKMASRMINARSETVAEKPSFRSPFKRHRCLIPVTGFYEWQKLAGGKKQPVNITPADGGIWALAGLYEYWANAEGSELESCTILTMAPNSMMASIHNRMPVILEPEDYDLWLDRDAPLPAVSSLFRAYSAEKMHHYHVSTHVNSPRNDDPRCIEQISI